MVKYLSGMIGKTLLVLALIISIAVASKVPIPSCSSPRVAFNDFPISLRQVQNFNMNDFFSGYNLNITIPNRPQFVHLREKITKLRNYELPQPGLRNYHFAHDQNSFGASLVTLSVFGNDTIIRWGVTNANSTIPDLTNSAVVTNDPTIICFDAVWIRQEQIAMVDCFQNSTLGPKNVFIYVNTSTKANLGKVYNDLYVPFIEMHHRKIRLLTQDGYHYLIRAYFAEHVDAHYAHNTYAEIMSVNNPMKPWTIRVMDRSFLHQDKLSIMDFQVYLGDIYLLDYYSGVIKFDITRAQTIVIVGRYRTDSGFTRLGVYSNNMDNQFLLVLAHQHAIFEVDWSNQIKPEIVTKYSIPDGSWLHDLWVNQLYVVVQLTANLTDDKNQTSATQSTYVFSRGSRTYLNAYAAIPHPNFHAFVEFQRRTSQMLTIDTERMSTYQIAVPTLSVNPQNPDLLNKQFNFIVRAESKNEYSNQSVFCTFTFKYIVVPIDSLALWPTGLKLPDTYYANYPGQLFIPLDRYVLGANITYGVYDTYDKDPPVYYILQQNSTKIHWRDDKVPQMVKYTFLRQQQYDSIDQSHLFIYSQDYTNVTHFSRCIAVQFTQDVICIETGRHPHINFRISNLTANRFHYYGGQFIHLAAILYEQLPNEVFVYDVEDGASLGARPIMFPTGYEGKVQSIEFLGHYLVVVLKYVKEIVFFDMIQCWDHQDRECQEIYRINSTTMTRIGVNYFSPVKVYTSDFHPFVLFIQCLDRVVIVDITRNGPIRLAEVKSPATQQPGIYKWQMAIARGQLILVNPPNTIQEHDLDELYNQRQVPMTKVFPTFGYVIPDKFDLDFSDNGNLIYITAIDTKLPETQNTIIMVYRTGGPAVASLYDVFHLNQKYDDVLIDATGNFGDYVAVAFGSILMMFRQYEVPILVFEDSFSDFAFNVTYTNDPEHRYHYLSKSVVKIANYPEDIYVNDTKLNGTDYLTNLFNYDEDNSKRYVFDDSTWFNGSVINYTLANCQECNKKINVINHVNQERVLLGVHDMEDYAFSFEGGYIQQFQSIIKMHHNGSINQFVTLPSVFDGESCILIEHSWIYEYSLSACKNGNQVYLYTTVYTASKPFVNGPYPSSAKHVTSMHIMQELLIIVDVDERPWSFDREGGVIIYSMNHDPFEPEIFDEIQFIDSTDLSAASNWPGGPCFIANAHFVFTNQTDTYRLVITELRTGFFVVDFKWTKGRKSVEILKVEFINLAEQLVRIHVPLPNAAFFTAITINKQTYDTTHNYWQTQVIVVTSNFHTFQVNLHIDKSGTVASHEIVKIYYRYGFYENQNYIKSFDGYFAVAQKLPTMLEVFDWYSPMVLSVYDTHERWTFNQTNQQSTKVVHYHEGTNIPVEFLLGGYTFRKGKVTFDWNFTITRNASNPFTRIGLLALHNTDARIRQFRVHERLIIQTAPGISSTQNLVLRARNDYHFFDVPFKLLVSGSDEFPGWAIALIVIGSVAIAAIAGYLLFVKFVKGKRPNRESEAEKSLLEREGQYDNEKDSDDDGEDDEGEDGEDDDEQAGELEGSAEGQQESAEQVKVESTDPQTTTPNISINRETISSVGEEEQVGQEKSEPKE